MQETKEMKVLSLGRKDSWEEGMGIHSSILAGKIPWTEDPGGLHFCGVTKGSVMTEHTKNTQGNCVANE